MLNTILQHSGLCGAVRNLNV
ncbi:hypothetical protein H4Q32_021930 [Labeo rohita]|uniref:Uncharacterized protein n=1 Tax=Labeo rohita TaxID=84645 RepID=A0ABQ8MSB2_LABRO|nr:hypothetical protein H4Q32_021930 [Labeo rohita]